MDGSNSQSDRLLDDYAAVLKAYVNDKGLVSYKSLKADRSRLDRFTEAISRLNPSEFERWSEKEKIAFWINSYNALTLKVIIDHYPIQASLVKSVVYPRNSIRQISGVWDTITFPVMGDSRTLDGIEHEILRKQYNEPRIHMALVCAAMGCPILRNEPYQADRLDAQLDDQTRGFLKDPKKFRIDQSAGRVYLSPIFKWFGSDFIKTYHTDTKFTRFGESERAVLDLITRFLEEPERVYQETGSYGIGYLDYDWSLNEQYP